MVDQGNNAPALNLAGMHAIVTGGAMGIGQAIAFQLAKAGASVTIADVDLERAEQTMEQIRAGGGVGSTVQADSSSTADVRNAVQAAWQTFGRIDILVNNAGVYPMSAALEMTEEVWDRVIDTNLKGVFFYSQAAALKMVEGGRGGKIINIASKDAMRPSVELAHYAASKAGVIALTKAMALELAPHNILVNAIAPGNIKTPGTQSVGANLIARGRTPEDLVKDLVRLPLGRTGKAEDIANAVLFLASSLGDYMTGSVVVVDGGFLLS